MKNVFLRGVLIGVFLILLASLVAFARGYRFDFERGGLSSTGILVASSFPDGAKIYINGKLKGATKSNITLPPGKYDVEIKKDGYTSWKKNLAIKGELVVQTNAVLFPQNPSLSPVTSLGISFAQVSKTGGKIILITENENPEKNGIYLLDNTRKIISIINPLKLIALKSIFPVELDPKKISFNFSPDEGEIIMRIGTKEEPIASYLISTDELNLSPFEITGSEETIETAWIAEEEKNLKKILETLKNPLPAVASDSFKIKAFSPDETKILYTAAKDRQLPLIIRPPLIATNQTPEDRSLKEGNLYVYDSKEDKNYLIAGTNTQEPITENYIWFPDSSHLVIREKDHISVSVYDGQNKQTVYSGPFKREFFAVTPDERLLILTNLNPQSNKLPDLYAVGIR